MIIFATNLSLKQEIIITDYSMAGLSAYTLDNKINVCGRVQVMAEFR